MNNNFSAEICEFHVQAIGTFFWCHHQNPPANDNMSKSKEPPSKGSQERAGEAALVPDTAWLRATLHDRALLNCNLVNFDQSSSSNQLILSMGRLLSATRYT